MPARWWRSTSSLPRVRTRPRGAPAGGDAPQRLRGRTLGAAAEPSLAAVGRGGRRSGAAAFGVALAGEPRSCLSRSCVKGRCVGASPCYKGEFERPLDELSRLLEFDLCRMRSSRSCFRRGRSGRRGGAVRRAAERQAGRLRAGSGCLHGGRRGARSGRRLSHKQANKAFSRDGGTVTPDLRLLAGALPLNRGSGGQAVTVVPRPIDAPDSRGFCATASTKSERLVPGAKH